MPEYLAPGVYVEETSFRAKSIEGVSTTTTGFVGPARSGPTNGVPGLVTSLNEFEQVYGDGRQLLFTADDGSALPPMHNYLWHGARAFFLEGGKRLYVSRVFAPASATNDGRAFATLPPGETDPTKQTARVESRFPGANGGGRVTFQLRFGQNLRTTTKDKKEVVTGLLPNDLVWIGPGAPVAVPTPVPTATVWTADTLNALAAKPEYKDADLTDAKQAVLAVQELNVWFPDLAPRLAKKVIAGYTATATAKAEEVNALAQYEQELKAALALATGAKGRLAEALDRIRTAADGATDAAASTAGSKTAIDAAPNKIAETAATAAADAAAVATAQTAANDAKAASDAAPDDLALKATADAAANALATARAKAERSAAAAASAAKTPANTTTTAGAVQALANNAAPLPTTTAALGEAAAALLLAGGKVADATALLKAARTVADDYSKRAAFVTVAIHAAIFPPTTQVAAPAAPVKELQGKLFNVAFLPDGSFEFRADATRTFADVVATGHEVRLVTAAATVTRPDGQEVVFDALALHPDHKRAGAKDSLFVRFAEKQTNADAARTLPILIEPTAALNDGIKVAQAFFKSGPGVAANDKVGFDPVRPFIETTLDLAGGNDGKRPGAGEYMDDAPGADPDRPKSGLRALEDLDDISIVAAPGSTYGLSGGYGNDARTITSALIGHAERMRYRIAVLDSGDAQSITAVRALRGQLDSKHAALYYPWVRVLDPITRDEIVLPPSGFVSGIYARNDIARGVHKAPANEVVTLALGFEQSLNKAQQEVLNPEGVNCFRFFEGRGFRLWGARTISSDQEWKYVNLRRYFAYLEHSIDKGTQFAVFEPNGDALWANVRRTIEDFLLNEWQSGALLGDKPEKAYFVRCDRSTMTQNDLDNGRLICLIGVAPLRPAEFVIFRIGQFTADRKS